MQLMYTGSILETILKSRTAYFEEIPNMQGNLLPQSLIAEGHWQFALAILPKPRMNI